MAKKRFTDIEIWDKEWYMELSPKHKCLMKYIFDKCDASGCWKPNWKLASLHINDTVTINDLKDLPQTQYEILESGKIFIPDFINFQYGKLSRNSPAHNPIFLAIEKNNLSDRVFNRVQSTPKEEEEEIEEEKEMEEEGSKEKKFNYKPKPSDFNGLPEIKIGSVIQLYKITKQVDLTTDDVKGLWQVFKEQNLTGKKYYQDEDSVYSHFINWSKIQKIEKNGAGNNKAVGTTKFNAGASELLDRLKKQVATK